MIEASLLVDLAVYSVQVGCVVVVGGAVASLVRIDAADVRYAYWRGLLGLCLALPWLQVRHSVVVALPSMPSGSTAASEVLSLTARTAPIAETTMDWVAIALAVLIAGVVIRLCRVGLDLWRLRGLRQAGRLAPPCEVHEDVQQLVRARAEIRYVPSGQPVTFGCRRPVILLPEMLRTQSAEIERVVLCHELFHVRRRDWIWVVAEEVVKAVLWFHPAVWWLVSRVRLAREEVVDELTVLATAERRAYLEALLVFADAPTQTPAAAFTRRRHLFRRMMLISKEAAMSSKRILVSVAAMTVVIIGGVWSVVSMFPLTQTVLAQGRVGGAAPAAAVNQAGPLERQAKPITPENPIPRRTFSVPPQNPGNDPSGAVVAVRVVLDRQGRVGEVRSVGATVRAAGPQGAPGVVRPTEPFVKAVIEAVRQWQYEPPADGPIAFDVSFMFASGSDGRLVSHGSGSAFVPGPSSAVPLPPPAPPPPAGWVAGAVRVGGNVAMPTKVRHVDPVYPPVAQSARVQGVVILEVVVATDGSVADARVLRSIPLLDQAAIDAVRLWAFTPTHLNGAPVPVIMTVTVQFTL